MENLSKKDQCELDLANVGRFREEIPLLVDELVLTCDIKDCFDHVSPEPIPSRDAIIGLIDIIKRILFPGYFVRDMVDRVNIKYYYGQEVTALFELLANQITLSIRHECLRYNQPCSKCRDQGHESAIRFIKELPNLRSILGKDVIAAREGDPAAETYDEIIFSYPGLFAIMVYRIAHRLFEQGIPLIPRIMTEYAHSMTGIDIHPAARIGLNFFIDHGTGVVIGATAKIGDRVRLYQGVTLGALSLSRSVVERLRHEKRHPTLEDDVVVYSGATILGGETVIGAGSVIGGNVWLTDSVPPGTKVFLKKPELVFKDGKKE